MTILGTRWTAREWTDRLGAQLVRAPQVDRLRVEAPLRLALWTDGHGPYLIDATRAYEAYQRADAADTALLDTTTASIIASLARRNEPPTWDDVRDRVVPWLVRPEDAADRVVVGMFGDLAIAFRFTAPITGTPTFVVPPAWGVDRETLLHRALTNLGQRHDRPLFRPLPDAPGLFRVIAADGMAASHVVRAEVQQAIRARCGSPAVVLVAGSDAVFVCAPNILGDAPRALRTASEVRATLAQSGALSESLCAK